MADEETGGVNIPPIHSVLTTESSAVVLDGVHQGLLTLAAQLAYIHFLLFGLPLVITSGKDGTHAPASLHGIGRALDFRTHDKSAEENQVFLSILAWAAPQNMCRVFDERVGEGGQHIHVEYHGA